MLSLREPNGLRNTLQVLLNAAMKAEQEQVLKADHYERSDEREAYRNGYKDKTISTRLGKITVQVPQVQGGVSFYPSSLEKGIRSERALKLAIAEMYVKSVATRKVSAIVEELCGTEVSSTQVSDAAKELDAEIDVCLNRPLGRYQYLMLDAGGAEDGTNQVLTAEINWNYNLCCRRCRKDLMGSVVRERQTVIVRGKSRISTQNRKNPEWRFLSVQLNRVVI